MFIWNYRTVFEVHTLKLSHPASRYLHPESRHDPTEIFGPTLGVGSRSTQNPPDDRYTRGWSARLGLHIMLFCFGDDSRGTW